MGRTFSLRVREDRCKGAWLHRRAVLALGAAVLALSMGTASAETLDEIKARGYIRVAIANESPDNFVDPSGEVQGSSPEIVRNVLQQLGFGPDDIQWVVTGFSSLIPGLQANRFDMTAAGMAIRPERCQQVVYSDPYTSYGEGLVVPKGNPKALHSYEDFKKDGLKVAVMAGAQQLQMMQKLGVPEANIVTIAANADAISTVTTGRADAYAAAGQTASDIVSKNDKVELATDFTDPVIDGKVARSWGGFNFNKESTDLRDKFNVALAEYMKTDGWKQTLLAHGITENDIKAVPDKSTEELCSGN